MTGWGNEWPVAPIKGWPKNDPENMIEEIVGISPEMLGIKDAVLHGIGVTLDGKHVPLEKVYNNIMPTHDPYTNPNAIIYYECLCGAILDPGTKSFASLNNHASEKGWKIRFSDKGYIPYCVKCGEKVE